MNNLMRFGIPIALGIVAASINWAVLQSDLAPHEYVVTAEPIKAGELFTPKNLKKLTLRGIEGSLKSTAIPYSEVYTLYNNPCARTLLEGDLVLLRDAPSSRNEVFVKAGERAVQVDLERVKYEPRLLVVGNEIGFVVEPQPSAAKTQAPVATDGRPYTEGPFRILSVGGRVNTHAEGFQADQSHIISIAMKALPGEAIEDKVIRLLAARRDNRILAIVQFPSDK